MLSVGMVGKTMVAVNLIYHVHVQCYHKSKAMFSLFIICI